MIAVMRRPSAVAHPARFGSSAVEVRWARFVALSTLGALAMALVTGIPTVLIPNGWFTRMTPVQAWAYPVWAASALLGGLLLASFGAVRAASCAGARRAQGAGLTAGTLTWLAVGCPICNKLVVAALGVSGALAWFAPLQPWLAALSLLMLLGSLGWRVRALRSGCAEPAGSEVSARPAH
jgi:hypothetical protein